MKGKVLAASTQRLKYVVADWFTTNLAFFLFNIARYLILYGFPGGDDIAYDWNVLVVFLSQTKLIWEQILIPLLALVVYWLSGYYAVPFGKSRLQELITTFFSSLINTALIYLALLTNDQLTHRSSNWGLILILVILLFAIVYAGRISITQHAINRLRKRQWHFNTLIIGNSAASRQTALNLSEAKSTLGYHVCGFVKVPEEHQIYDGKPVYRVSELPVVCKKLDIDHLIISLESPDENRTLQLLYQLFGLDVPIQIQPDTLSYMTSSIHMQDIYAEPFIDITRPVVSNSSLAIKRAADVILSILALIVLSPIMLAVGIAIKLDSNGDMLYSQERIGKHRKPFRIYKFRSMRNDAEANGPQLSSDSDTRITRIGKYLRKYRIDELPQFWNVLRGDMSLVGPRPERAFFINQIVKQAPYYTLIHQVRPGITSWGMVKYGYASTLEEMVRRTRYDLIYLSNMSLAVDAKILLYTVKTVIGGKGK